MYFSHGCLEKEEERAEGNSFDGENYLEITFFWVAECYINLENKLCIFKKNYNLEKKTLHLDRGKAKYVFLKFLKYYI